MKTIRPFIASLFAAAVAFASVDAAAATRQPTPIVANNGAAYRANIDGRVSAARNRIEYTLRARRIAPAARQQIMADVDWTANAIRDRVAWYAAKHYVTAAEDADVHALAAACANELQHHHGSLASWNLLY